MAIGRDLEPAALEVGQAVDLFAEVDPGGQAGGGEVVVSLERTEEEDLLARGEDARRQSRKDLRQPGPQARTNVPARTSSPVAGGYGHPPTGRRRRAMDDARPDRRPHHGPDGLPRHEGAALWLQHPPCAGGERELRIAGAELRERIRSWGTPSRPRVARVAVA